MALARKFRLQKNKDIDRVFRQGRTVKSSFFLFKYISNNFGHGRLAIAVPAKITKKAVIRNRIRRRLWSALPSQFQFLPIDAVIILTHDISQVPFTILQQVLGEIFR